MLSRTTIPTVLLTAASLLVVACGLLGERLWAQGSRSKSKSSRGINVKSLDVKAERLRSGFVREALQLAQEYENAGQLERARDLLQAVLKLDPNLKRVKDKIRELSDRILSSNEIEFDLDVSRGWATRGVRVFKGRAVRIQVSGSYKFITDLTVGPAGFPTADPRRDMAAGIRCGALMGMVLVGNKPGKPFYVGERSEVTPKEDGVLFLRVNAPAGSQCSGKLRVRLSGYVRPI